MPGQATSARANIASKLYDTEIERLKESIRHHRDAIAAALDDLECLLRDKENFLTDPAAPERV